MQMVAGGTAGSCVCVCVCVRFLSNVEKIEPKIIAITNKQKQTKKKTKQVCEKPFKRPLPLPSQDRDPEISGLAAHMGRYPMH